MKAHFRTPLETRLIDELEDINELRVPLEFYSAIHDELIVVPEGFRTDFASVPRVVLAYLFFGGKGKKAATIHDWVYSGGLVNGRRLTREECDDLFKEALQASGYSAFTVYMMFGGVRLGGASRYEQPNLAQSEDVERLFG